MNKGKLLQSKIYSLKDSIEFAFATDILYGLDVMKILQHKQLVDRSID